MTSYITWVITEKHEDREFVMYETKDQQEAYSILREYTQEQVSKLSPCMYEKIGKYLTTDFKKNSEFIRKVKILAYILQDLKLAAI